MTERSSIIFWHSLNEPFIELLFSVWVWTNFYHHHEVFIIHLFFSFLDSFLPNESFQMRISQCETFICSQLAKCMEEVGCSPTVGLPPLTSSVSPELVNFRTKSHILFSRTIKNQLAIESVLKNSIPRGLQSGSKQDGTGKVTVVFLVGAFVKRDGCSSGFFWDRRSDRFHKLL